MCASVNHHPAENCTSLIIKDGGANFGACEKIERAEIAVIDDWDP